MPSYKAGYTTREGVPVDLCCMLRSFTATRAAAGNRILRWKQKRAGVMWRYQLCSTLFNALSTRFPLLHIPGA